LCDRFGWEFADEKIPQQCLVGLRRRERERETERERDAPPGAQRESLFG